MADSAKYDFKCQHMRSYATLWLHTSIYEFLVLMSTYHENGTEKPF